jgi:ABC-2 type transport system permease protein
VQLTATSRAAGGIALAALGLAFVVRASADTAAGSGQNLAYASFLGWAERVSPFGDNRLWWLAPAAAVTLVLLVVADALLQRRDLGSGMWAARPGRARASGQLSTPLGLAWRLQRGPLLGWTIGYAVLGSVVGSIAASVDQIVNSPSVEEMFRKMSGGQGTILDVFFGAELRFMAIGAAAYGIATALRLRSEEAAGRAEVVLATHVSRSRWLASHALIAMVGSLWLLAVVGVSAGVSARSVTDTGVGDLLPAALATAPAVLVCVALTVVLFGFLPHWSAFAWGLLALFVLLGEFGVLLELPGWALGLSPFDHLGSLPGGTANGAGLAGLLVVAAAVTAAGFAGFRRRDLTT